MKLHKVMFCLFFFSVLKLQMCPFYCLFSATFVVFFVLVILLLKAALNQNATVLSSVAKHKKAGICLMEKIHM